MIIQLPSHPIIWTMCPRDYLSLSLGKHAWDTYYTPGAVLSSEVLAVDKIDTNSVPIVLLHCECSRNRDDGVKGVWELREKASPRNLSRGLKEVREGEGSQEAAQHV